LAPVILYSQAGCPSCAAAKQYLAAQGVSYQEKDIRSDPEILRELVEDLKSSTTPTLVVGENVVIGFDPDKFLDAIGSRGSEGKQP
jgi:glutaredoxin